jgi:pyruvate dehydrogenase E1 component alpha subunit
MPRNPIALTQQIEYLSILDEHAVLDKALEPQLTDDELKTLYRAMLLARRADERMLIMHHQGRLGTFPQTFGHEAITLGAAFAIKSSDWMVPYYRELPAMLYRGWLLEKLLLYWNGFEEGGRVPEHVNDLPYCVPIASQLLHAAGLGMAMNIKGDKNVVLTFFGDGAASEGDCHEAMNFASVFSAPVVFVCINNQYAISVPVSKQMKSETIAQRAISYNMPGIRVDGNDILAVYAATKEAVDRARAGGGPTLIEGLTYRLAPHTTADDPRRYRTEEESKLWQTRDPLIRLQQYVESKGLLNDDSLKTLEEEIDYYVKDAVQKAEAMAKSAELTDPLQMFDYLYAEIPDVLKSQRDELDAYLKVRNAGLSHK